jgi:hypothetical protein
MSDALDRIKQRQKPKVAPRDASLTSGNSDIQPSRNTELPDMQPHPEQVKPSKPSSSLDIQIPRHTDTETYRHQDSEMQTERSTFRLEANLIKRLKAICQDQRLSREVLIEAMFEFVESHPETMDQVLEVAHQKHEYRQQLANRKRAEAMMNKFGGGV